MATRRFRLPNCDREYVKLLATSSHPAIFGHPSRWFIAKIDLVVGASKAPEV